MFQNTSMRMANTSRENRKLMQYSVIFTILLFVWSSSTPFKVFLNEACLVETSHPHTCCRQCDSWPVWPSLWTDGPLDVAGSKRNTLVLSSLHMSSPRWHAVACVAAQLWTRAVFRNPAMMFGSNFIRAKLHSRVGLLLRSRGACCWLMKHVSG